MQGQEINYTLFWIMLGIVFAMAAFILSLRIVWRVEKRLDTFFKILTVVFALVVFRLVLRLLEEIDVLVPQPFFQILDALPIVISVFALIVMDRLIRKMDGER